MRGLLLVKLCFGSCWFQFFTRYFASFWRHDLLVVFIAGINDTLSVTPNSGGGGTSNDMPWRDKDEDLLEWARLAMRYAHAKHYPGNRLKRSLSK